MLLLMKPEAAHFLNTWDMEVRYATIVLWNVVPRRKTDTFHLKKQQN